MKVLVTGGAGFIGTNLVAHLASQGFEIIVLDDYSTSSKTKSSFPNVSPVRGDVCDGELLSELVSQVEYVYHLASAVGVKRILEDPFQSMKSTVYGAFNVLEACSRMGKRLLITSTSEVYGKQTQTRVSEYDDRVLGQPQKLRWSYSESKALIESAAAALSNNADLEVVTVRLFNTIGPGQTSKYGMVVPSFVQSALSNSPIQVYGDGTQARAFCDVRDVVRALTVAINSDLAVGQVYNIGGEQIVQIRDLALLIKELTNSQSLITYVPYSEAYKFGYEDTPYRAPDISKVQRELGWTPSIPLESTILDIVSGLASQV